MEYVINLVEKMENRQHLLILTQFREQLVRAVELADREMPESIVRTKERHYIGTSAFPLLESFDQKKWEYRETGIPVAFSELMNLIDSLDKSIEILKSPCDSTS